MPQKLNTGSRGSSVHKDGIYRLRIEEAEIKNSANSGNDYINLRLAVLRPNGQSYGPSVFDIIVLTENTEWKLKQLFDSIDAPENEDVDVTWLKNKEVFARVTSDDSYNDEERNKIKNYLTRAKAEKQMAAAAEAGEIVPEPTFSSDSSSAKAKSRGRTTSQPSELRDEEAMPL